MELKTPVKHNQFVGIDLFKLMFTLLIPLLHIEYTGGTLFNFLEQFCARLGVPFFFCCTGFLFERGLQNTDLRTLCAKYVLRHLWILVFWGVVAIPITLWNWYGSFNIGIKGVIILLQNMLFKTPGYLWYLTASIVGIILYSLLKYMAKNNCKLIFAITGILYIFGTLGNSWGGVLRIFPEVYYTVFLTTRNGVFFAPLLITVGACAYHKHNFRLIYTLPIALLMYTAEVQFIRNTAAVSTDTSMYFSLPIVAYLLLCMALNISLQQGISSLLKGTRQWGVLVYCMQYPCFEMIKWIVKDNVVGTRLVAVDYFVLLICATLFYWIIKLSKIKWLQRLI